MVATLLVWLQLNYQTDKLIIAWCRTAFYLNTQELVFRRHLLVTLVFFLCTRPEIVCISRVTAYQSMVSLKSKFFVFSSALLELVGCN